MDPYVYPGTSVLVNLRDIRDPTVLAQFEAEATARRLKELRSRPLLGSFDARHLKAVHGYVFQDVFSWAGQFRTVNIARSDQFYFAFANQINPSINKILDDLRRERLLEGLEPDAFSHPASYYLGELNAVHPFRDGNGRTQREFIRELSLKSGYELHWNRVSAGKMHEASRRSFQSGDSSAMAETIRAALEQLDCDDDRE